MNNLLLIIITFTPLVGAVLTLLPWGKWFGFDKAREERLIKLGSIAISTAAAGPGDHAVVRLQPDRRAACSSRSKSRGSQAINVSFHIGVDGLSVPMIFLTTFLTTLGLYYSSA
jgi:NADH-quinone oxidoreductase subunit M